VRVTALRLLRVRASYDESRLDLLRRERAIVCANHVSLIDGVIIALTSPVPLTFGVETEFSKRTHATRLGMAWLSRLGFGAVVPVDGSSPFGIRALAKALERGESVMLFPEGCISETGEPLGDRPGVDWLVRRSGAHLCRVRISGAEDSKLFAKRGRSLWPRIHVAF
jgi:1-acyl-sn-glycerol-3-phosphate acyltransferase